MTDGDSELVRAAGGLVWRQAPDGGVELLVIHRPKYDDWTFPKGKLDPGEVDAEAALREVEEETGLRCALGPELSSIRYRDARGRPKVVRYWAMTSLSGEFRPNAEVDDARWVPLGQVSAVLSYDRDRGIVPSLVPAVGR